MAPEILNSLTSAKWRGTRLTVGFLCTPRKLRRAMRNRRWEKKACKALTALMGIPVCGIGKRLS